MARLALLTLAATGVLVAVMVANPPHAYAHNDLVSSQPADGGTVSTLPATASLTFSEPLGTTGLQVAVTYRAGAPVAGLAASRIADATLTQELPTSMTPGQYTLAYRVVSVDGHPVGGTISFTVDAAAAPSTSAASPTATTSQSETATPTGTSAPSDGTAAATTSAVAAQAATGKGLDGGLSWWWVVIAVAVVLGLAFVLARRRGRVRATGARNRDDAS